MLVGSRGGGLEGGADSFCVAALYVTSSSLFFEPGPHPSEIGRHCSPNTAACSTIVHKHVTKQ